MILTTLVLLTLPQAATTHTAPASTPRALSSFHWFDLDRDGDLDALAIEPGGTLRVLHNRGEGRFLDGTTASGLGAVQDARAALLGDVDLDEAPDLVLSTGAGLRLFRQAGLSFVEDTPERFASLGPVEGIDWVDANGDQRPDLHLSAAGVHRVFANEAGGFRELDLGLLASATDPAVPSVRSEGGVEAREREPQRPAPAIVTGPRAATGGTGAQTSFAAVGGGAGSTVTPSGSLPSAAPAAAVCSSGVLDQAGTGCLPASTEPTLGMLYPLGNEFMIDAVTGNVGIGTTTPGYALEVSGQIVGGTNNTASGAGASIVSGDSNSATGQEGFVGGGFSNLALSDRSVVGGGVGNRAAYRAFVGGGDNNAAMGNVSTIAGGKQNDALQTGSTVGGGEQNVADAAHATVSGGFGNSATGAHASVGGGLSNLVTGAYGSVPGGRDNIAAGAYSYAAGRRARAVHDGAFVWADSADADFSSTAPDQFLVRAAGGMGVGRVPDPSFQIDVEGAVRASDTIVSTKPTGGPISVVSTDVSPNLNADLLDGFHASAFSQLGSQIETPELADDAVTAAKIAAAAVGTSELANDAVTASQIAADAVDESHLQAASVGSTELQVSAVQSANLAAGSVLAPKIGDGQVTLPKLDPSGGTAGQVLGHDGTAASWLAIRSSVWSPISSLPFTITASGTYYLTGNLTAASGSGIEVTVDDVVIDLNGFSLIGSGLGNGVFHSGSQKGLTVRNGAIKNWVNGIFGNNLSVDGVTVHSCNGGILAFGKSIVSRCIARDIFSTGIYVLAGGIVVDSTAEDCNRGIRTDSGASVENCIARSNVNGFDCVRSVLRGCTSLGSTQFGFLAAECTLDACYSFGSSTTGFVLVDSSASACFSNSENTGFSLNRSTASQSTAESVNTGFALASNSTADRNIVANANTGIVVSGSGCRLDQNDIKGVSLGIDVNNSGNVIIRNTVSASVTDFDLVTGNQYGQIISGPGQIGSTGLANLSY